jgi:hypothetical protein
MPCVPEAAEQWLFGHDAPPPEPVPHDARCVLMLAVQATERRVVRFLNTSLRDRPLRLCERSIMCAIMVPTAAALVGRCGLCVHVCGALRRLTRDLCLEPLSAFRDTRDAMPRAIGRRTHLARRQA